MEKTVLPLLMKEREAADRLSVSFRTMQTWRSRGGGPAFIRIAGAVRYAEDDLDSFIRAGRTPPSTRNFQ
jgi:predicted site-specific integrase-resolvase